MNGRMYDKDNIFAKIISNEIEQEKIFEDDYIIVIKDINPSAPIHLLVITKGDYIDLADFTNRASTKEIVHYFKMIDIIAKKNNAEEYRIISNKGKSSGQSVFHFHTHILSGSNNKELIDKNL